DLPIPPGYTVTAHDSPAAGVEHFVLTRTNPAMVVNVARIAAGAPVSLRAVLSNDTVAGDAPNLETTSGMCARVHCVVGVNADFFSEGNHEPLGAFVTDGALLRTPSNTHHQLSLTADGAVLSGDGAGADGLRSLWARVGSGSASRQALLRFSADEDVRESVGGSPVLVRDGKRWFTDPGDDFTDGRHPRTLVGWSP